jgi:hypothetical protein
LALATWLASENNMDSETQTTLHHLAMALQQGGAIAKAVAHYATCIRDPLPVADMMIAQRLLREALARHHIPCSADLGGSEANDRGEPRH